MRNCYFKDHFIGEGIDHIIYSILIFNDLGNIQYIEISKFSKCLCINKIVYLFKFGDFQCGNIKDIHFYFVYDLFYY